MTKKKDQIQLWMQKSRRCFSVNHEFSMNNIHEHTIWKVYSDS